VAASSVTVELPEELVQLIGSTELTAQRIREALVLDLLRAATLSQGQAAHMLGISRWDMLDLMARYRIPSGAQSAEEVRQEVDAARRFAVHP